MNKSEHYGISPGPCDRLNCNLPSCYGWDYCRQARQEMTKAEFELMWTKVFGVVTKPRGKEE